MNNNIGKAAFVGFGGWEELTHKISSEPNELIFLNNETFTINQSENR